MGTSTFPISYIPRRAYRSYTLVLIFQNQKTSTSKLQNVLENHRNLPSSRHHHGRLEFNETRIQSTHQPIRARSSSIRSTNRQSHFRRTNRRQFRSSKRVRLLVLFRRRPRTRTR